MTERERWIVYPLLFLALGAALRDKLGGRTTAKSIKCEELLVIEEQPLGQEVLLARIGRPDPSDSDQQSGGQLLLNGQFTVVDPGPVGTNQTVKTLVRIGRAEPPQGVPSLGYVWIQGQLVVNGPINAMQYAYQGVPIMPALRRVLPGLPDLFRAVPEAIAPSQQEAVPQQAPPTQPVEPESQPPAEPADDGSDAPQSP
jgi:hypothetical protein